MNVPLELNQISAGTMSVNQRSMCGMGFSVRRPCWRAVSSPWRSAAYPWAYSCAANENTSTGSARMKSPSRKASWAVRSVNLPTAGPARQLDRLRQDIAPAILSASRERPRRAFPTLSLGPRLLSAENQIRQEADEEVPRARRAQPEPAE